MQWSDALIVGGGPGGSSVAGALRGAGLRPRVIDARAFPRDKICAGWVTPEVVEALGLDLEDYARERVLQPITGFRSGVIGGKEVETRYGATVSYGIRRREFDHYLLQRAAVDCQLGEAVKSIERRPDGWVLNGRWAAPLLIGAGGHFCPVARKLGARASRASVVAAQEIEFAAPAARGTVEEEVPELFFCRDLAGYGWCFRKGDYWNIGLGRVDARGLTGHLREFCAFLRARGKIAEDLPGRFRGHAYQLYEQTAPRLIDDGALLVGDAAGLAYPQSGEGIRPAVESGLMAADAIVAAEGDFSRAALEPYAVRVADRFGPPRAAAASGWLPAAGLQLLASRLLANRWFARHVVLDRWFLHRQQGALARGEN